MAETNSEDRDFTEKLFYSLNSITYRCRITRAIAVGTTDKRAF